MKTIPSLASLLGLVVAIVMALAPSLGAQVTKESLPGVTNYAHVETTVACAGATTPAAMEAVKRLGYKSVINLREATEQGADIDEEAQAAKAAGINFVHLPLNSQSPDPAVVPRFLAAVTDPANQPAFIHCASGNRASALWAIKRVQVDHWSVDRAMAEASELGLTHDALKAFVLDYLETHKP
jgi:uncharacterized protein (TIGR01244 family)